MTPERHLDEQLDALLDGRLDGAQRRAAEEHLAGCSPCRRLRDALEATREALRGELPAEEPPAALVAAIRSALDREDAAASNVRQIRKPRSGVRFWMSLAAGLAAVLVAALAFRFGGRAPDPVKSGFEQFARLSRAPLGAVLGESTAAQVEERWATARFEFPVRVFDFGMMGINLAGGDVSEISGARAARAVYRRGTDIIICWMYEGRVETLPATTERRTRGEFEFHIFRHEGRTLVAWQEGETVCLLVGDGDAEEILALAMAKAMKPPPRSLI
ncbi:MAG: zf-HC2 domain-containing protein [Thermoanaerobaculia bacterium]